jgi:hypothetical protein
MGNQCVSGWPAPRHDVNRRRMRFAIRAVLALPISPVGFTALPGISLVRFGPWAAYPMAAFTRSARPPTISRNSVANKSRKGKGTLTAMKRFREVLRAMAALGVLRDDVVKPILAARGMRQEFLNSSRTVGHPETQSPPACSRPYDAGRGYRIFFGRPGPRLLAGKTEASSAFRSAHRRFSAAIKRAFPSGVIPPLRFFGPLRTGSAAGALGAATAPIPRNAARALSIAIFCCSSI